jgi:hypothetical protein
MNTYTRVYQANLETMYKNYAHTNVIDDEKLWQYVDSLVEDCVLVERNGNYYISNDGE